MNILPSPRRLPLPQNTAQASSYDPSIKMDNVGLLMGSILQESAETEFMKSTRVEWIIPNYSYLCANIRLSPDEALVKSPPFTFANSLWNIFLQNDYLLKVRLENKTKFDNIRFSFRIKKLDGTSERRILSTHLEADSKCLYPLMYRSFIDDEALGYKHNNTLTLICFLESTKARGAKGLKRKRMQNAINLEGLKSLSKNLRDLYINKDNCDSVLIVQDKAFEAHRNILMARSSVFSAMFHHDTLERKTGKVFIPDCDADSFGDFLEYIYCGSLKTISSSNALHLYKTANKYNIQELKNTCINYLMQNLTTGNVYDVFTFAEDYDEKNLFDTAQEYFNKNFVDIAKTSEWNNLFRNNFPLATKILNKMAKS